MAQEFLLPDPGEGIHEAEILEIHVSPGDKVKDGDPLFSVETDKAVVDIPASFDGAIEEVLVEVGAVVEVGSVLLTFTESHETTSTSEESAEAGEEQRETDDESLQTEKEPSKKEEPTETEDEPSETEEEPSEPEEEPSEAEEQKAPDEADDRARRRPVPASPATRSLAKKLGVDLHEIEGSGPDGRIEPGDVQAAAGERKEPEETGEEAMAAEPGEEEVEWIPLRGVRRATARHMMESWNEIPHVTHHDVADITQLEKLRSEHAAEIEDAGGRLSITAFLVKASAAALRDHPRFNASLDVDNERLALKSYINIGVAVDTDDGLVVPVINDVPEKSIAEIAVELPEMAKRMRSGERSMEDLKGGTFTITNPGGIGGTSFNPIINHPEVAILGAARARQVPVISNGDVSEDDSPRMTVRLHLPLVLAFDHRVNDGADAARFMNTIRELLEDPGRLVLHV